MSPPMAWTRYRRPAPVPDAASRAVLHFRNGERLVVDVDAENGSHLRAPFERPGKRRFDWFETTDGFLVGADFAEVAAIEWLPPAAAAPEASPLDDDHLVLRFSDGHALRLSQIAADDIDRLRGATICHRAGNPFQLGECAGARAVSVRVETLALATLPARWMDAEPS
jgi:hypothetical protein